MILGGGRTHGISFGPFLNCSDWQWLVSFLFLTGTSCCKITHRNAHYGTWRGWAVSVSVFPLADWRCPQDPSRVSFDDTDCRDLHGFLRGREAVEVMGRRKQCWGADCSGKELEPRKADVLVWAQGRKRRRNGQEKLRRKWLGRWREAILRSSGDQAAAVALWKQGGWTQSNLAPGATRSFRWPTFPEWLLQSDPKQAASRHHNATSPPLSPLFTLQTPILQRRQRHSPRCTSDMKLCQYLESRQCELGVTMNQEWQKVKRN